MDDPAEDSRCTPRSRFIRRALRTKKAVTTRSIVPKRLPTTAPPISFAEFCEEDPEESSEACVGVEFGDTETEIDVDEVDVVVPGCVEDAMAMVGVEDGMALEAVKSRKITSIYLSVL